MNSFVPDVIGFTLGEARKIINESGLGIGSIIVTAAPRLKQEEYDESFRVIRIKKIDSVNVELLVCNPCTY